MFRTMRSLAVIGVAAAAVSCGRAAENARVAGVSAQSANACEAARLGSAAGYGRVDSVAGAFTRRAGEIVRWQVGRTPGGPTVTSRFAGLPPDTVLTVCYFDGEFSGIPQPYFDPVPPPYDRIVVILGVGNLPILDAAGYRDRLQVVDPASAP